MFQVAVVVGCELVAQTRQIVVLVGKADGDAHRARLAVIAVNARALVRRRGELADYRVVALFGGGIQVRQGAAQVVEPPHAG